MGSIVSSVRAVGWSTPEGTLEEDNLGAFALSSTASSTGGLEKADKRICHNFESKCYEEVIYNI